MDFVSAIRSFYRHCLDFNGRSDSAHFWYPAIYVTAVSCLLLVGILAVMSNSISGNDENLTPLSMVGIPGILLCLFLLTHILPLISVTIRRLHDTNKTGWLVLILFIPFIGCPILLLLLSMKGTDGENKYGPKPLASLYI